MTLPGDFFQDEESAAGFKSACGAGRPFSNITTGFIEFGIWDGAG
jgi:hypothetical protein